MTGCVPQPEVDGSPVHHDIGRVVVEHRRDVLTGEGIGRVADEQASFTCEHLQNLRNQIHLTRCKQVPFNVNAVNQT